ncbi:hypothetical protein GZ77_03590 [Endozoicomonas montiporae]|uniref:Uncharacterized protein n=2 Tax=Endozoicomonas montiporae TaxID=1027273 RepID=A0A081NB48_9GAMM|nr:hypothetical protein [Endozoicomonas montiporae]AMO56615.1 hypothetical protein EZMO1_2536 [Endozoicomonas montiporae CL-33]KEQ15671.1 hypothetical protein GZ77_03590 [Endozoicomonas montiporae]
MSRDTRSEEQKKLDWLQAYIDGRLKDAKRSLENNMRSDYGRGMDEGIISQLELIKEQILGEDK